MRYITLSEDLPVPGTDLILEKGEIIGLPALKETVLQGLEAYNEILSRLASEIENHGKVSGAYFDSSMKLYFQNRSVQWGLNGIILIDIEGGSLVIRKDDLDKNKVKLTLQGIVLDAILPLKTGASIELNFR